MKKAAVKQTQNLTNYSRNKNLQFTMFLKLGKYLINAVNKIQNNSFNKTCLELFKNYFDSFTFVLHYMRN